MWLDQLVMKAHDPSGGAKEQSNFCCKRDEFIPAQVASSTHRNDETGSDAPRPIKVASVMGATGSHHIHAETHAHGASKPHIHAAAGRKRRECVAVRSNHLQITHLNWAGLEIGTAMDESNQRLSKRHDTSAAP